MIHQPVLLQEVLTNLDPKSGEIFIDATINRGGHAKAIAERLGEQGQLIGLDADRDALAVARANLAGVACSVTLFETNFSQLGQVIPETIQGKVNGILLDLGFSSEQMDDSGRGFSFRRDEPLFMTLSAQPAEGALTAATIINGWTEAELTRVISEYGEERFARPIAKAIVLARRQEKIMTTFQLVAVIKEAVPVWYTRQRLHFATKTFQALRIATNDELTVLAQTLPQAWSLLAPGGRLAVISFHSLEARIVKNFFQFLDRSEEGSLVTKHALKPTYAEVKSNPRSRSAQLRVIKKIS
jgi:16S rRNA (cytosine1402-N4)-methyltransferase